MKYKIDYKLLIAVLFIAMFGIIMIYSASSIWAEYKFHDAFKFVKAQGMFFIVGILVLFFLSKVDYHLYFKKANTILFVCFLLLILLIFLLYYF